MESSCAKCPFNYADRACKKAEGGRSTENCPTVCQTAVIDRAFKEYLDKENIHEFAANALRQEASCYIPAPNAPGKTVPTKSRIQETAEFCQRMNYKKIGLAFCGGLHVEAAAVSKIMESYGFEVVSVICKVGGISKEKLGIEDREKIIPGRYESMCNPIGQAMLLNEAKTDFNIVVGLCVGHDSLFLKYSEAMCTVLSVKDRLLGHNPMAAVYSSYYSYLGHTE